MLILHRLSHASAAKTIGSVRLEDLKMLKDLKALEGLKILGDLWRRKDLDKPDEARSPLEEKDLEISIKA